MFVLFISDTVDEDDDLYDFVEDEENEGDEIYEDLMRTDEPPETVSCPLHNSILTKAGIGCIKSRVVFVLERVNLLFVTFNTV